MGLFSRLFGKPAAASEVPAGQQLAGKRVLVVEPSITIQKVLELTLNGLVVTSTGDGAQAKAALRMGNFDAVVCSVVLPDMTGYDLCTHVKTFASPAIPFILLQSSFEPSDEDRVRRAGADAVVTKPFEPGKFLAELDRLLHRPASHS